MADSTPLTKPHFTIPPKPIIHKGKSYSQFLFKSLIFALFIIVLPLLPSQAPDFVSQTILTQLWELLHLLFIGIAVAYGLFSRRNVDHDMNIETQSLVHNNNTSCYVSTMFPVASVFNDDGENPCGYDENGVIMMHCDWNYSQYYESNNNNNSLVVMDEQYKPQLSCGDDFSDVVYDGSNVVQAWNSEYNHGQSMVVMAHPYYTIGECDEIVGYKPLGLPVRSLKSIAGDLDGSGNNTNESDSSSGSRGSCRSSVKSRDRKHVDLSPDGADQKFDDVNGSDSLVPWRSRSRKMGNEESHGQYRDATASAVPWQDRSERVEIEENYGEFDNVVGSVSPIPWHSRFGKITNEESHGKFSDATGPASSIPWQEGYGGVGENHGEFNDDTPWRSRSRWKSIEESRGKYSDAAASASYITWQEESQGVEVEENDGETNDVAGSASTIPWHAMSSWMESEGNHEMFNDGVGSSSTQWQESFGRMEFEESQGDFAESASPISWETMTQAVENGENHRIFNDAPGSLSPIPWNSRSKRIESEGKHGNITDPLHFRPGSTAEPKSESFNSQVFQSTASVSSHRSTYSSDSVLSDNMNLESEEMGQKKSSYGSFAEKMTFQEEDSRANMAYRGSSPRLRKMATKEKYCTVSDPSHHGSSSEKMKFQEEDSGANMASRGPSLRLKKMATREKHATVSSSSHFRPMSVDETQFESLGSRSFKSTGSFSPRTSLTSSLDSDPSENLNLPKEDLGKNKSSHGPSSASSSPSPPAIRRAEEASSQAFHSRGYSDVSLLQGGLKSSLKDEWIDLDGSEDQSNNKETGLHLQSDTEKKHRSLSKGPPKGKSVRTRRNGGLTSETMRSGDMRGKQTNGKEEKKTDNVESVPIRREKSRKGGSDYTLKGINKQNSDLTCPKPEGTLSSYPKRNKEEPSKNVPTENLHIEPENSKKSSDEDRMSECVTDSGLDSEVDKKASEFIARFKAQIRLQKEASMDRSRGLNTMKRVLGDT